ncbi:MAG: hypothetical protein AAF674_22605 [Pseudomonadota bacterium]
MAEWTVIPISVLILVCLMLWARHCEARAWNGGIDAKTGERWRYFDTDSQGGRGYRSSARTIWISYSVDNQEDANG